MFRRSSLLKVNNEEIDKNISKGLSSVFINSNSHNKNSIFKLDELNLDSIMDCTDGSKPLSLMTVSNSKPDIKTIQKQLNYINEFTLSLSQRNINQNINKYKVTSKMFSSKVDLKARNYKILADYIPQFSIDVFTKWNKNIRKRPNTDIDDLLNKDNFEPLIKQLKPNKYQKGFDIIPKYLKKRSSKKVEKKVDNIDDDSTYKCKSVVKAFKVFHTETRPLINVSMIGPHHSGKSSLIGSILSKYDVFESAFIKKTLWEATKAGSPQRSKAWLVDTSIYERRTNETVISSSYVFEHSNKLIRLTDSPGNKAYFIENTIGTLSKSDVVILTIDYKSSYDDYLNTICKLFKVFSIQKVIIVLTDTSGEDIYSGTSIKFINTFKRCCSKVKPLFSTVCNINDIKVNEITSIMTCIDQFDVDIDDLNIMSPLMMEVDSVHKPVDSVLPVIVGRVITGGFSSGVNNPLSKAVIVPKNIKCTVKSMNIEEKDGMKTRSFAFAGDNVEIVLAEMAKEEIVVKRGDLICHPRFPISCQSNFIAKLVILTHGSSLDYVPIVRGTPVYMWSHTKCSFAIISDILSIDYLEKSEVKVKKSPRVIYEYARMATVNLVTEELIPIEYSSRNKLDILLLFHQSVLFAAGKFIYQK